VRLRTDDDARRHDPVWLGPEGSTFPVTARYSAWAIAFGTFVFILALEFVTPLSVGVPPVWEMVIAILVASYLGTVIDHERPIRSVWQTFYADLTTPRAPKPDPQRRRCCTAEVRVRRNP
jgi:hypothetical protein